MPLKSRARLDGEASRNHVEPALGASDRIPLLDQSDQRLLRHRLVVLVRAAPVAGALTRPCHRSFPIAQAGRNANTGIHRATLATAGCGRVANFVPRWSACDPRRPRHGGLTVQLVAWPVAKRLAQPSRADRGSREPEAAAEIRAVSLLSDRGGPTDKSSPDTRRVGLIYGILPRRRERVTRPGSATALEGTCADSSSR